MLTPREIVDALDRYIVGQERAKRAVAVALRNRYRRSCLSEELRDEITPKNIIMMAMLSVVAVRRKQAYGCFSASGFLSCCCLCGLPSLISGVIQTLPPQLPR